MAASTLNIQRSNFPQSTPIAPLHLPRRSLAPARVGRAIEPQSEPLRPIDVDFLEDVAIVKGNLKRDADEVVREVVDELGADEEVVGRAVHEWIERIFELVKDNIQVNGQPYEQAVNDGQVYEPISHPLKHRLGTAIERHKELHLRVQEKRATYPTMAAQLTADAITRETWCRATGMVFPDLEAGEVGSDMELEEGQTVDLEELEEELREADEAVQGDLSETMETLLSRLAKAEQIIKENGLDTETTSFAPQVATPITPAKFVFQDQTNVPVTPRTARKQILRGLKSMK
ncbi:hypothetical protein M427DRAFT_145117 [Gonapodya prolifera JEL478]|uniref:Mis14-domain-containing protein n=1 Tax=Gonapodya prolifera (strain JEL478) TaxID=1344416 RepID=A0A139AHX3_GONPJ|nr:hypothetical protein M427DRAFT_145117 [Gonapodya prolifera JEL478]|eukprot:KXS16144.1 hypothetical protein M427DRAFT_145117 [Gonapodya prolifera JEL478]